MRAERAPTTHQIGSNRRTKPSKSGDLSQGSGLVTSPRNQKATGTHEWPGTCQPNPSEVNLDNDRGEEASRVSPVKGESGTRKQLRAMVRSAGKARAALERGFKDKDLTGAALVTYSHALNGLLQTEMRLLEKLERATFADAFSGLKEVLSDA